MHSLRRRLANGVVSWTRSATHPSPASACGTRSLTYCRTVKQPLDDSGGTLASPWSALQRRGAKVLGSDVELRDVDTGNKVTERFRTDEAIERVFVEEKSFTFLYQEGDSVMIMEPSTYEQLELPKDFFGKNIAYLKDSMTVTVQYFDGKPMSASVPQRVACKVVEAPPYSKGMTATPQYKRVMVDNGLTILAPSHITTGDEIIINTTDDSYITRAKE